MNVAGALVLRHQAGAEQQRVVGAERHGHTCVQERAQWYGAGLAKDAERHIRCRADLAGNSACGQLGEEGRIFGRANAMTQSLRGEVAHDIAHMVGAQ